MPATGNTAGEVDQQKMALLTAIAQQGSQGQQAFQAEAARRAAAQQAAVASVAGQSKMTGAAGNAPKAFTQQLQAKTAAQGDVYAQDAAMSGQAFNNSIAQTSASNAAYMDQAKAAVPVVQAQTAGLVAQIRAEQEAARAEREYEIERRRMEAEQAALDRPLEQQERELRKREIELALAELDGEDGMTDEEKEEHVKRIEGEALSKNPVVGRIVSTLLGTYEDFDLAAAGAEQAINAILKDEQSIKTKETGEADPKVWSAADRKEVYRKIYEAYNPGKKAPDDPYELGNKFIEAGVDPRGVVPGYVPPKRSGPSVTPKKGGKSATGGPSVQQLLESLAALRRARGTSGTRQTSDPYKDAYAGDN